jgi:hypothetical protein
LQKYNQLAPIARIINFEFLGLTLINFDICVRAFIVNLFVHWWQTLCENMKKIIGLLTFCTVLSACSEEVRENQVKKYFDLKGLIEKQIKTLNTQKPVVQKLVIISDSSENQSVKTIDWAKELELFMQADLNKPAFIQSYQVDSSSMGVKYTLKETEKLPIKYLNISRKGENGISIEALINYDNYLYATERHLKLSIKNSQLIDYQIEGFQKIIFGDKKIFKINGIIKR